MNPITMTVAELKPALAGLGKVIAKRCTLPVLGCVRIERTREGRLQLTGTDLDFTAIAQLATPDQGAPTTLLVPLEDLANVAKTCGRTDTLALTKIDKDRVAIRFPVAGQILEHRCESLPVEEFPTIVEIRGEPVALNDEARRAIHDALDCASTDTTRLILNAAFIDVSNPKAHYIVGTDGRHLFASNSHTLALQDSLLIPSHRFLGCREFNGESDWRLRVAKPEKDAAPQFEITTEHWRFIGRSFEGNYPNWRQVIPDGSSTQTTVEVDPASADSVIQTIGRLPNHDAVNHAIGLEIQDRRVRLLAKSSGEDPWTRVELEGVKASGKDVAVHLNRHLLAKALRFGLTRLEIIDAMGPLRFISEGRQMIVMPTRPNSSPTAPPPQSTPPSASAPAATTTTPPPPAENNERNHMPENSGHTNGGATRTATTTTEGAEKSAIETALAQIEVVRGDFRNGITGLNKLADALKQAQRESKASVKEIQSVRQTIRSLQSVRI